jgi:hypothetical protein
VPELVQDDRVVVAVVVVGTAEQVDRTVVVV